VWSELFPKASELTAVQVEAQLEFMLEQMLAMARARPGLKFYLNEDMAALSTHSQSMIQGAIRKSADAFSFGAAPRAKGRLTIRVSAQAVPDEGVVNLAVKPISQGNEKPLWAAILTTPLSAAFAAVPDLAEQADPQSAFNVAQHFVETEWAGRAGSIFDADAFEGGLTGTEFLEVLKGLRPFLDRQRPSYALVSGARMVQEIRASIQRVRVMA
jgi:hypothetical protein